MVTRVIPQMNTVFLISRISFFFQTLENNASLIQNFTIVFNAERK